MISVIKWAWQAKPDTPAEKLVLVSLANSTVPDASGGHRRRGRARVERDRVRHDAGGTRRDPGTFGKAGFHHAARGRQRTGQMAYRRVGA